MERIDWVFGYGSLIWNPGFDPVETVRARLAGYARSFCLRSIQHRGTEALPGLVLGLDPQEGALCQGVALRIAPADHDRVLAELRDRELVTDAYRETILPLALEDGRRVSALAYVMRRDHWQYAGDLPHDEQARIIAAAHGGRGANADYLFNTAAHLAQIGMADDHLDALSQAVRAQQSRQG
ncbi:gamma-glutamylcyclotransferase [Paracoccus liaowanqingii]|uniref:glutathione-specific gamma-glutamylcyclotransferase n=1 Tax=Paracoccus liaowanqingii TaxID=2560053 RepID=A0A4V1BJ64_9RHOB|nr:gamma-glutamylcyclotransferase [Paracoccus liaowanqingii]QBX35202.1 gamma-glutamylcyclotransferase [Paracoccus liaowanqingii]